MMATIKQNQSWWERHPMSYDWDERIDDKTVALNYFRKVDSRFRESAWFAQSGEERLFSTLIPYQAFRGKKVLEIGCGLGSISEQFSRTGAILTAVDLTTRATGLSHRRFALQELPGLFLQANAEQLPFEDNSFDYVWSWGVLHHTPNTKKAIREVERVLKPGGRIAIMVYNRYSLRNLFHVIIRGGILQLKILKHNLEELENLYSDGFIAKHYSASSFKKLFSSFRDVQVSIFGQRSEVFPGYHRLPKSLTFPIEPIARGLLRKFGWFLFVEAVKPS